LRNRYTSPDGEYGRDTVTGEPKTDAVIILTTAPASLAPEIARALVDKRLVACVNIVDVRSIYRWEGAVCDEPEQLLVAKTVQDRADAAIAEIRTLHRYELPEMIVLPVTGGYLPYLAWIAGETGQVPPGSGST